MYLPQWLKLPHLDFKKAIEVSNCTNIFQFLKFLKHKIFILHSEPLPSWKLKIDILKFLLPDKSKMRFSITFSNLLRLNTAHHVLCVRRALYVQPWFQIVWKRNQKLKLKCLIFWLLGKSYRVATSKNLVHCNHKCIAKDYWLNFPIVLRVNKCGWPFVFIYFILRPGIYIILFLSHLWEIDHLKT